MAKTAVTLRIVNRQYQESLEPKGAAFVRELTLDDEFEIMTEGTVYTKNGAVYIAYEESEDAGLENNRTLLKVTDEYMDIRRYGEKGAVGDMDLHLEEGVTTITRYHVPMGVFELEIYTNKLTHELDETGYGKIFADYNIRMEDVVTRRNQLEIRILPS